MSTQEEPYEYFEYDVQTSARPLQKDGSRQWKSEVHPDYYDTYTEAKALALSCLKDCGRDNPKRARVITRVVRITATIEEFKPRQNE